MVTSTFNSLDYLIKVIICYFDYLEIAVLFFGSLVVTTDFVDGILVYCTINLAFNVRQ